MAAASAAAASSEPVRRYAIGMDPGSVNMGCAVYDLVDKKCIKLMRVQLRAPNTGGDDIGHHRLLQSLAIWMSSQTDLLENSFVFVENQPPEARDEIVAVQTGLQMGCTMLGVPCRAVNAAAYKARFAEHFQKHPRFYEFQPHRRKENQKAYDRRSAITNGKMLIDRKVVDAYEKETRNAAKNDDAYEAFFIAWYGAIALLGDDDDDGGSPSGILDKPVPAPRRKVADGPHKRGRVEKTKAQAKREERLASKAAAEATAAAAAAAAAVSAADGGTIDLVTPEETKPSRKRQRKA